MAGELSQRAIAIAIATQHGSMSIAWHTRPVSSGCCDG
jgi:hypothetical protein